MTRPPERLVQGYPDGHELRSKRSGRWQIWHPVGCPYNHYRVGKRTTVHPTEAAAVVQLLNCGLDVGRTP